MSKITIVSRGDQALLIDISGCASFKEAIEQLSSTFLSANQFWQEQIVDLNLGSLLLNKTQAAQIIALVNGVGALPKQIFARSASTFAALEELQLPVTKEQPDALLSVSVVLDEFKSEEELPLGNSSESPIENNLTNQESTLPTNVNENEADYSSQTKIEKIMVFEEATDIKKKNPLYLRQTLRAGQAVSHKGDLIIIGDVNAGAEVMAEGDITIWGSLRGIAHAGINGDTKAEIRALRLQPIQIRIANYIARSPDKRKTSGNQNSQYVAEIAKLVNDKIRIVHKTFDG